MSEVIGATYKIEKKIGSGGGGNVFLAEHVRLNKKVVLKADKRKITTRPELLRREVDTLKNLSHPYIPQVYDFFVEGDTVYTVMDYIEGESLDKPLKRGERFSQPQVIKWARQLLEALCYLHNPTHGTPPKGYMHSDIKPANLMRTKEGNICLIDFNIALALGEENVVGCSAGYASPEHYGLDFSSVDGTQMKTQTEAQTDTAQSVTQTMTMREGTLTMTDSRSLSTSLQSSSNPSSRASFGASSGSAMRKVIPDVRSDIYSVGATLYHLLSGKKPAKHAKEVVPLSEKEFSRQIVQIITKAMNPNPNLRYQTAEEMLEAFSDLHEKDERTKRWKRKNRIAYTAIGVCFVLGVVTSFVGLKRIQVVDSRLKLVEYSQKALAEGDTEKALKLVMETIPEGSGVLTPSVLTQSQKVLTEVLGVYDLADGFKRYKVAELPSNPLSLRIASNGKTAVCVYEGFVAVLDTETAEILVTLPAENSALAEARYLDDDKIIYAGEEGIKAYNIRENKEIWSGRPATAIAVSQDGTTVAAIYKEETFATVYDAITGQMKQEVDFQGKYQNVAENDSFANPNNNLLELNADGTRLAVSFQDGSLRIFNLENVQTENGLERGESTERDSENIRTEEVKFSLEILDETSEYTNFDGGFHGNYFAFSAGTNRLGVTQSGLKKELEEATEASGTETSETDAKAGKGKSIVVVIDTEKKAQVGGFQSDGYCKVATDENGIYLQENNIFVKMNPITGEQKPLVDMSGEIRSFDVDGIHTVAISTDKLLFFDENANPIGNFVEKGTSEFVQIANGVAVSGSLNSPVIQILRYESPTEKELFEYDSSYEHAEARVSEDEDTMMLFSYKQFRICESDGTVVAEVEIPDAEQVYDQQYIRDQEGEWLEVIYNDGTVRNYDGKTGELLSESVVQKPEQDGDEEYFTGAYRIVAPLHGTPMVYDRESGKWVCELEKDAYLTYVTEVGDYIVTQYVAANGTQYGVLLNEKCEVLATLPCLCDVMGEELYFDYATGKVKKTRIYSMEEMMELARGKT